MLSFQSRMLKRAAEICGGSKALGVRLGTVNELRLTAWMEGRSPLPGQVFLKAADIVLEDDITRAAQDRRKKLRTRAPVKN